MTRIAAVLVLVLCARAAAADPVPPADAAADRAFRDAMAAGDLDALEALGAARPATRWTDDAWAEAARLASRNNDFARARRDLEQVIAISGDAILVRRARVELARLASLAGSSGEWTAVAAEHERLVPALHTGGDPRATLRALEDLVRANPQYPRRVIVMLAIANVWEREGEGARAVSWLREAVRAATDPLERLRSHAELVRALIRTGALDAAEHELAALTPAPPTLVAELRASLDRAEWRRTVRWGMWGVLALLAAVATFVLRRAAGSWRAAGKRLLHPPAEAIFLIPIAAVLIAIAYTGNPLVARAVRTIAIAGIVASWLSGALQGGGPIGWRRALVHALAAVVAVGAVTYLAVDDGHLIDFVLETWRAGHELG